VWPYIDGNWHNVLRLANLWGARAFGHDNHAIRVSFREGSNEIYHTWTDPQFMIALQNISRWYGMGLIDQDFIGRGGGARSQLLSQNQAGVFFDFPVSSAAFNDSAAILAEIPDFQLVAFQPPANIFGQRISEHQRLLVQPHGWAISHTNPDPVRTMMFMDYFYSQHGRNLLSFGGEGVSWEYDADGNPVFLPITFDHPGQANPTEFIRHEQGGLRFIGYMQNFEYERQLATPAAREAFAINYGGPFAVRQVPTVGFTEAELQTINTIRPVLQTYLNEQIQSMILGDWTLIEGQWDAFVAGAVSIGRDDYVAAWQSAVNRALGN
jgi:putative aldouronate transport system substrate-binding protein